MTQDKIEVIIERLDKIVALLELQTFGGPAEDATQCAHEKVTDLGTFGMRPGEKLKCNDCGEIFSRAGGEA